MNQGRRFQVHHSGRDAEQVALRFEHFPPIINTEVYTQESLMTTLNSRVFMNGNSQAVRIPQEFRLNTSQVEITRNKDGDLVIHAIPENRGGCVA